MNIEISAKEYRDLLDILHITDVVMSGHRREEDRRFVRHHALIQKLYALARGEGLERLMGYNESMNRYVPTRDFEQSTLAHTVINEYGDHLFWDQLISLLSERDAAQAVGGTNRLSKMSGSDRQKVEEAIRQRYIEEFSANGVANLAVIERFSTAGTTVETSD